MAHDFGNGLEAPVAHIMPPIVIEGLEMVEVDQQQCGISGGIPRRCRKVAGERYLGPSAVREIGQWILHRKFGQARIAAFQILRAFFGLERHQ